jgi:xanthine/uracil permease
MAKDDSARLADRRQGRRFGLTLGVAFLVIAGILAWREHPLGWRIVAGIASALVLGGLIVPTAMLPVERGWMRFAHLLSRVTTPIVMGILFFVIITPLGLLRRAFGKHGLPRGRPGESMWTERPPGSRQGDLKRQF